MKIKNLIILIIPVFGLILSCKKENNLENEISKVQVNLRVDRFEQIFGSSKNENLPKLKKDFPFLFPKQYKDSVWLNLMKDPLQKEYLFEIDKVYGDFEVPKNEIVDLFKHLKYYYNSFNIPRVITLISDSDYRDRVIVTDSIVLISLNFYLGKDTKFYESYSSYIKKGFESSQITQNMAEEYAKKYIPSLKNKTFLNDIIYSGKVLYFKDVMLPNALDEEKIGYTKEELQWAESNEGNIWSYFIEKELLYSNDNDLISRFIKPAPFSKFYLEIDSYTPGRLGQYIGWQIVKSYMKNNQVTIQEMLQEDEMEIFINSKFKPKK